MVTISVDNLTKIYRLYDSPKKRLRELLSISGKRYHREFKALNGVTFKVEKGQTCGIIGQNGSGKSTLLQIICGVVQPTKGSVNVHGRISALLELGAGFNPEFSGRENVYMNGALMGFTKEEIKARMPDIEAFAEIAEFIDLPVKTYSSGMYVRLAFAAAINVDPDILIVDEALAVGDMKFQIKCIEKMKQLKKLGKTIIFVTHDVYSVRNFCTQAIWLSDGRIKLSGDVLTVTDAYSDFMKIERNVNEKAPQILLKSNNVLLIKKICVVNEGLNEVKELEAGTPFSILVDYKLNKDQPGLVGGMALYGKDNTYVCGLNTKLDGFSLPCKKGEYRLKLSYTEPSLLPGTYFIDVGFFESSGIVALDYKAKVDSFLVIKKDYDAEGICLLKHKWEIHPTLI